MPVETRVDGDPGAVEAAAGSLRRSLAAEVSRSADSMAAARTTASGDWSGGAGEAFSERMRSAAGKADDLAEAMRRTADEMDVYAAGLRTAQQRMQQVREDAASAGLVVSGTVVQDPGSGPPHPGELPADADATSAARHEQAAAAHAAHQRKVVAYQAAATAADDAKREFEFVLDAFVNMLNDIRSKCSSLWATWSPAASWPGRWPTTATRCGRRLLGSWPTAPGTSS